MGIKLNQSIIIVDEAHNIIEAAEKIIESEISFSDCLLIF